MEQEKIIQRAYCRGFLSACEYILKNNPPKEEIKKQIEETKKLL